MPKFSPLPLESHTTCDLSWEQAAEEFEDA